MLPPYALHSAPSIPWGLEEQLHMPDPACDQGCLHRHRQVQNAEQLSVAAQRRLGDGGRAFTEPVTEGWIGRNRAVGPLWGCNAGRRHWRRSAAAMRAGCRPAAVGGDGREGGRAARREDRRSTSTVPATPGAAKAHLADVDALVTTNPEWPDTPRRRRGGRSVAVPPAWQRGHWRDERPVSSS